ncbi:MAG: hypothetical protein IJY87_05545 [Bacilli bacterium]|nr:hypothetical protein [Bacilli bacterium]
MSKEDKKRMIENVKATMTIENFNLVEANMKLLNDYIDGKITMEKALEIIKNKILTRG